MIRKIEKLRQEHGMPSERAQKKIIAYLSDPIKEFINQSPFVVLSTSNTNGDCDASPRGGKPGFVKVIDDTTLLVPDIRGNRLFQSLENILSNPKAGLLFFVPGNNKMVRVNGRIEFLEKEDIKAMEINNEVFNPDETAYVIQGLLLKVDEAYRHCSRALSFSDLWNSNIDSQH